MSYATRAGIIKAASEGNHQTSVARSAYIDAMLPKIDALIDAATGTWWDSRERIVKVLPPAGTSILELPARILTITSVVESGETLDVHDYAKGVRHLEKPAGVYWDSDLYDDTDTGLEYPVIVTGTFGYTTTPSDIVLVAEELGAILAGLKTKTYISADRVQQAVTLVTAPEWLEQQLVAVPRMDMSSTAWKVEEAAA